MKLLNMWPLAKYLLLTTVCNIYIKTVLRNSIKFKLTMTEDCTSDKRHFYCCSCMFYLAHVAHVTVSASLKKLHVSVKVPLLLYMDHYLFVVLSLNVSHLSENCNVNM